MAIVGAGITGAFAAEHLSASGQTVCVIDRGLPGLASTAASTSLLLWEIDASLTSLSEAYGFETAAEIYRKSFAAVAGLGRLIAERRIGCNYHPRHSLYLAAGDVGWRQLAEEHRLRQRANLPGELLDHRTLLSDFGMDRAAALWSPGAAEADPLMLAHGLLDAAAEHGAELVEDEVTGYQHSGSRVVLELGGGKEIEAGHVVLATGYVMPAFVQSDLYRIVSTWCIATIAQPAEMWPQRALIWEASEDYLYARTDRLNRVIVGGEDEETITDGEARDRLVPEKSTALRRRIGELVPNLDRTTEFAWSGAFGETSDGLPLIGPVPGYPRIWAAFGYGGNGITFSFLASRIIAAAIAERSEDWHHWFAIDRPPPQL